MGFIADSARHPRLPLFELLALALGLGSGAELQKPLAIAVIGSLSVSTIVTLVFLPTLMSLLPQRSTPTNIQGRS